jgi:hypothetical protein
MVRRRSLENPVVSWLDKENSKSWGEIPDILEGQSLDHDKKKSECNSLKLNGALTLMCSEVTLGTPFSTIIIGRHIRPPSLAM